MVLLNLFRRRRRPKEDPKARAALLRFLNGWSLRQSVAVEEKQAEVWSRLLICELLAKSVMYLEEYETCRDGQPEVARPLFQIGIDLLREGIEEMRGLTQHLQETSSDATLTTGVQELPEEFEGEQQIEFGHHPTDDRELFRPCVEVR